MRASLDRTARTVALGPVLGVILHEVGHDLAVDAVDQH
jgi:hypothetical protein